MSEHRKRELLKRRKSKHQPFKDAYKDQLSKYGFVPKLKYLQIKVGGRQSPSMLTPKYSSRSKAKYKEANSMSKTKARALYYVPRTTRRYSNQQRPQNFKPKPFSYSKSIQTFMQQDPEDDVCTTYGVLAHDRLKAFKFRGSF